MHTVEFRPPEYSIEHKCKSTRSGEWIVFRCSECPAYERRLNWRTGKMTIRGSRADVHHTGMHNPTEYPDLFDSNGWRNLN